ncbi:MAG: hypothetical protein H6843_05505 [Rhodospirillaceae bacterium]|nr:hypothetical protein [Rhodospirillaceae bacterium]
MLRTTDLSAAEQLVVWSARAWMAAYRDRRPVLGDLEDAYALSGIGDAAHDIDELFCIMVTGQRAPLSFGAPQCPAVHAIEAAMVNCLAAYQMACRRCGGEILAHLLEPAEAHMATAPAERWAKQLGDAGWPLSMITRRQLLGQAPPGIRSAPGWRPQPRGRRPAERPDAPPRHLPD